MEYGDVTMDAVWFACGAGFLIVFAGCAWLCTRAFPEEEEAAVEEGEY